MRMIITLAAVCMTVVAAWAADGPAPSNGIGYPAGWQDWAAISVAHRTDNETVRLIVGNDVAVKAVRAGRTNPWPDGTVLGKVVWKAVDLDAWPEAKVPGELVHAEFMFKDSKKFA
ncbi:cytochrome P460 family protein [Desulfomicrobium salsuginis]